MTRRFYKGYTLDRCSRRPYGYWSIALDGKRIDTALTFKRACWRVRQILAAQ